MPIIFFLFRLRPQGETERNVLPDSSITSLWQGLYGLYCLYSAMQEFGTCGLINVPGPRHVQAGFWHRGSWWFAGAPGCWVALVLLPAWLLADARLPIQSRAWSCTAAARNTTACLLFSQELKHMPWLCRSLFSPPQPKTAPSSRAEALKHQSGPLSLSQGQQNSVLLPG